MYRQVKVHKDYRCLQRIFWRFNSSEPLQIYELATVTYGTASASFLATRALKQVALDEAQHFPEGSEAVISDFYVDDLLSGASTIEKAQKLRKEISSILSKGCFELSKWCASHEEILQGVKENDRSSEEKATKRSILSTVSSLYDPLGLSVPVIFTAKTFLQRLWAISDFGWDDNIPENLISFWETFNSELRNLREISVPRCFMPIQHNSVTEVQLHGFGDASEAGYGCCLYMRTTDNERNHTVRLLCARSRVAPLKKQTIPRLELCAALLLAQLTQRVISILRIDINRVFLWTDSEITLHRIKSDSSRFKTFVANRVSQIQECSSPDTWKYVPSKLNPADIVSRGLLASQIDSCQLWWNGPYFLSHDESKWPAEKQLSIAEIDAEHLELREILPVSVAAIMGHDESFIQRVSELKKLVRYTAIWLRYFANLRTSRENRSIGEIRASEYDHALKRLIVIVQQQMFPVCYKRLSCNKEVDNQSKLRNLNPFVDSFGIIRVGVRLSQAEHVNYDQRFPMVLLDKHHFTTILARHLHVQSLNAGPQSLLNNLRQRFWIIRGKNLCKKIFRQCLRCFRTRPQNLQQLMGQLPSYRVQPARAFVNVGIDYFGPILVTPRIRGRSPTKMYAAIFVCLTTKAVHIEVAEDLTTKAFIAVLQCFIARRGHPSHIFSDNDNATNFVGAHNELTELHSLFISKDHQNNVQRFCTESNISWHFIPARSPHHGGLWEAAVKSAKIHLKRAIGIQLLTATELRVLLTQVEACLNSRPLTAMSDDPADLSVLTPGHFLVGGPLTAVIQPDLLEYKISRLSRWKLVQHMLQSFWRRWSCEYLSTLHQRQKGWNRKIENIQVGTLVLLKEENIPPQRWIMGRIIEVYPGPDGLVRVVQVKTSSGQFRRAITKVCPLPLEEDITKDIGMGFQGGRHDETFEHIDN